MSREPSRPMLDAVMPIDVLFVCTANECRSPLAEALARRTVATRSRRSMALGGFTVEVGSTGTHARSGRRVVAPMIEAGDMLGVDLRAHRSRLLDADLVAASDLVLVFGVEHARRVLDLDVEAASRCFLLRHAAELASHMAPAGSGFGPWLAALGDARGTIDLWSSAARSRGISDPVGGPRGGFTSAAATIATATDAIMGSLMSALEGVEA